LTPDSFVDIIINSVIGTYDGKFREKRAKTSYKPHNRLSAALCLCSKAVCMDYAAD
jgi:hypothetical protein